MEKSHAAFDYNYIADGIYVGTNQCCQIHFNQTLLKDGATADISLEEVRVDQPFGVEAYLWLPVKDHFAPSDDQLLIGVAILQKLVALKKKVYVHCKNGHGRAPTLVIAYLTTTGKSLDEAIALLESQRPSAHLQDAQIAALRRFSENKK